MWRAKPQFPDGRQPYTLSGYENELQGSNSTVISYSCQKFLCKSCIRTDAKLIKNRQKLTINQYKFV